MNFILKCNEELLVVHALKLRKFYQSTDCQGIEIRAIDGVYQVQLSSCDDLFKYVVPKLKRDGWIDLTAHKTWRPYF